MSLNELIRAAITPIVSVCEPDSYDGVEAEYCTFRYDDNPDIFAEGKPDVIRHPLILSWHLPRGVNPLRKKAQIRTALMAAGFTCPYVTNASDELAQLYVFECEIAREVTDGGV